MLGGIAGGFASSYVEDFLSKEDSTSEKNYTPVIVEAVAGSAISAFVKNDLIKGVGNGMVGVAGYNLAKMVGESSAKTSGVGSLLAAQNAIGSTRRRFRSRLGETEEVKVANVQ